MELITSAQNSLIKRVVKLGESKKARKKEGLILLDGVHLCEEFKKNTGGSFEYLFVTVNFQYNQEFDKFLDEKNLIEIPENLMQKISPSDSPIGILGVVDRGPLVKKLSLDNFSAEKQSNENDFVLLLDKVQDPGNLGTIIRTAASTGVTKIYANKGCGDFWSPKVLRASMGGVFYLDIYENADFFEFRENFRGKIIGTILSDDTKNLYDYDLTGDLALMVGNEGAGIAAHLESICDDRVLIPMTQNFESLNVAMATSVCCFEKVRQENFS